MLTISQKPENKLSDGRRIRALPGLFTQAQTLTLHKSGVFAPEHEGIMLVREYDDALKNGSWASIENREHWWRSDQFGFYPKGFDIKPDLAVGSKLVWIEKITNPDRTERMLVAILDFTNIADEKVFFSDRKEGRLKDATGMGIIRNSKLDLRVIENRSDLIIYGVSPADGINPEKDITFKDVLRPNGLTNSVDADGFALMGGRIPDSEAIENPNARFSHMRHLDEFEGFLPPRVGAELKKRGLTQHGWFGSIGRQDIYDYRHDIDAYILWSRCSGVAVVDNE